MSVLQVQVVDAAAGADLSCSGPTVVYDAATNSATFAADGSALMGAAGRFVVWSLVAEVAHDALLAATVDVADGAHLMRCDRVDFPADGVAFLHTHQGPGIRVQVEGLFAVETEGMRQEIETWGAWFEAGPEPVYAEVRGDEPAAFVRVMLLPFALHGSPSIRYVRDEDREKPKSQRYTVFLDEPLA
ncbi:MAG: hypothetical protein EXQ67_08795 [Thermoleophilia bacterium]|nr:hypothetical protein [Thermoleophilia bacterium]